MFASDGIARYSAWVGGTPTPDKSARGSFVGSAAACQQGSGRKSENEVRSETDGHGVRLCAGELAKGFVFG